MNVPAFVEAPSPRPLPCSRKTAAWMTPGSRFLDFLQQSGAINAYFIRSGMGLMYTFSMDDTRQITRNVCGHLKGATAVLVGCNGIWDRNYDKRPDPKTFIEQGIELGNFALEAGAAGVVYTMPEALLPEAGETHQQLIERYFRLICERVQGPVFVYQPPNTTKDYEIAPATLARIADIDNFVAGKFSTADGFYIYELVRAVRGKTFGYILGHECLYYTGLMLGARRSSARHHAQSANLQSGAGLSPRRRPCGRPARPGCHQYAGPRGAKPVDFLKMYATEKGYDVPLYNRSQINPYMSDSVPITKDSTKPSRRFTKQAAPYCC